MILFCDFLLIKKKDRILVGRFASEYGLLDIPYIAISFPLRKILSIIGVVYAYGMNSIEGIGWVMNRFATFPLLKEP